MKILKTLLILPLVFLALIAAHVYWSKKVLTESTTSAPIQNKTASYDPLLLVVLMVKNEETSIIPTLKPFIDGGVDAFFIFDTGSTDQTIARATDFLTQSNAKFKIAHTPFIDFATSRNRGLDLAQQAFPNAAFMLMPDAEWYIKNAQGLLAFCNAKADEDYPAYLIRIMSTDIDFYTPRLIRARINTRFVGEVHEVLNFYPKEKVPANVFFELAPSKYGKKKSKERWERDLKIFERKFAQNPTHTRSLFYYAQTLWCLNRLEEAHEIYRLRAELTGWDEEDYLTWYRLGRITEQLAQNADAEESEELTNEAAHAVDAQQAESEGQTEHSAPPKQTYTWSQAMDYYLRAFTERPSRAEPLIRIAKHYLDEDNHHLSYIFALRAAHIPYPEQDILMVEKQLYESTRWELLSQCAKCVDPVKY